MSKSLICFILSVGLHWVQSINPIRGASCVKVGGSVYVLGGQTYTDSWGPLKYVYTTGLYNMYLLSSSAKGWSSLTVTNYEKKGLYTTAAAPIEGSHFYFIRSNSTDFENLPLHALEPSNITATILATTTTKYRGTKRKSSSSSTDLLTNPMTLLVNDVNPDEIILIEVVSDNEKQNSKPGVGKSAISIYNNKTKDWKDYSLRFMTSKFYITAIYQGFVYIFGPGVDINGLSGDNNLINGDGTKLVLARFDLKNKGWTPIISTGDIPNFSVNYSHTQKKNQVFLVGENQGTTGFIYVLSLNHKIPKWVKVSQDKFTGYGDGCLTHYEGDLYHYFGTDNKIPIQKIDPNSWNLDTNNAQDDSSNSSSNTNGTSTDLLPIIMGALGGSLLLGLIIVIVYFRRKRHRKLEPPEMYRDFVICDPPLNPYTGQHKSKGSTISNTSSNQQLFEINELNPDECFVRRLSTTLISTNISKSRNYNSGMY